ncbi:MAG: ribonuclease R [Butyrivibrio sp.]|nr:ribonuclease R [Butyrivibrio sp.]
MDRDLFLKRKKVINDLIHDKNYVPMKAKEIAILLDISKEDRQELSEVLDALVAEGAIGLSKRGKYGRAENTALVGKFMSTQKGFGFVTVEGEEDDIYIAAKDTCGALNNDTVRLAVTSGRREGRSREGKILKVLERGTLDIVGTYEKSGSCGFVLPDDKHFARDIFIPRGKDGGAADGHKVLAHINDFGDGRNNPEGEIISIIGHQNDPGTDIMSIVCAYGIPTEFPDEVMDYVRGVPDAVSADDIAGRKDCRGWRTVTIDGEDAKDLDDAITLTREEGGYRLGVHIADVSEYVKENSPLDREALNRGTSVYLVDRVIPMLPHKLSNGICSLNQGVDRLALSCIMDIDEKGCVTGHEICETVINVDRRMSYAAVQSCLDGRDGEAAAGYGDFVPMFELMKELAGILRSRRCKRGFVDFDFPESKITLDENGSPLEIKEYERNTATRIIEDFMLIANETVAEDYFWQALPFVYRTHDKPDPEKIKALAAFVNNFGYSIRQNGDEVHPKELQKLLAQIEGSDTEALISRLTLRSMKRAQYTTECSGHFGLAAKYYTHFTSPIRRYPDLQIHRIIKENLNGGLGEERAEHYAAILPEVSKQSSVTERRADDAEREVEKLKKTEYMSRRIGEIFEGVISGVTAWGLYVELPNTVEGMVHVTALAGDYYKYDAERYELFGERTHKAYRLGQQVTVKCVAADKLLKTVDFKLVERADGERGD